MATKATKATKAASVGTYGVMPDKDNGFALETTVFTVGSPTTFWGALIGGVHALTWIIAFFLIMFWGNNALGDVTGVTDSAKTLGSVYGIMVWPIVVVVLLHAAFAKKAEMFRSTIGAMVLLWLVFFELSLGCAYLAYSMHDADFYSAAVICHLFVCGGCAMIVTFYVNFTHNGTLTSTILDARGGGTAA
tara:strand:+ start:6726 stop:7295 length:570 start_codon:yes stop_codon:yes gene_type:complete